MSNVVLITDAMALHNVRLWVTKTKSYAYLIDYGIAKFEPEENQAINQQRHFSGLLGPQGIGNTQLDICCKIGALSWYRPCLFNTVWASS